MLVLILCRIKEAGDELPVPRNLGALCVCPRGKDNSLAKVTIGTHSSKNIVLKNNCD